MTKATPTQAIVAIPKADDDKLSSYGINLSEVQAEVAAITKLSGNEVHKATLEAYKTAGTSELLYKLLVLDVRRRLLNGEIVGECETWTSYEDRYLRRDGESLPTCMRRIARLLEGINPDTKHRNKRKPKLGKKSARKILEDDLDNSDRLRKIAVEKSYKQGFSDAEKSLKKLARQAAADKKSAAAEREAVEKDRAFVVEANENAAAAAAALRQMLFSLIAAVLAGDAAPLAAELRDKLMTAAERRAADEARLKSEPPNGKKPTVGCEITDNCGLPGGHDGACAPDLPESEKLVLDDNADDLAAKGCGAGTGKVVARKHIGHRRAQAGRLAL